ncbi:hypothetical protein [Staphylococcus simulans]|uniref:hypothetical protein n=1 Tax=Staphylococcus simulans TaxID=1286 RepID=UPI000E69DA85|nr:hypothetical protein [Staphylococcus simulans]RIN44790.1 hypothetical protein BU049_10560 [Staphylococcus simulans]RIN71574.1 hypothetical protein BU017_06385 [Staphylococcus simulans]
MKIKILGTLALSSALILTACGQEDNEKKKDNKTETTNKSEKKDKQKQKSEDQKNDDNVKSANKENQNSQKQPTQEKNNQNVDLSNIQDRNTLESIIYGNYTEEQKVQAYNSAVANGVIPQGNVMEGPAGAAYESSLRVESGQEKSVYEQNQNNTVEDTQEQPQKSQQTTNNKYITDENQDWRANTGDGLSSGEKQLKYQIENGTYQGEDEQEIYEALQHYEQQYGQ